MQETGKYNFNEAIALYKRGQWIYPAAVKRITGLPNEIVSNELFALVGAGRADQYFECSCPYCNTVLATVKSVNDLPDALFVCETCGATVDVAKDVQFVYKLLV